MGVPHAGASRLPGRGSASELGSRGWGCRGGGGRLASAGTRRGKTCPEHSKVLGEWPGCGDLTHSWFFTCSQHALGSTLFLLPLPPRTMEPPSVGSFIAHSTCPSVGLSQMPGAGSGVGHSHGRTGPCPQETDRLLFRNLWLGPGAGVWGRGVPGSPQGRVVAVAGGVFAAGTFERTCLQQIWNLSCSRLPFVHGTLRCPVQGSAAKMAIRWETWFRLVNKRVCVKEGEAGAAPLGTELCPHIVYGVPHPPNLVTWGPWEPHL